MTFYVYQILEEAAVAYVGRTTNPKLRWQNHKTSRKFAASAEMVITLTTEDYWEAADAETQEIVRLRPRLNRHLNCCERLADAMPTDEARKKWRETPLTVPTKDVLAAMPGWNRNMAYYRFGSRDGKKLPNYTRQQIERNSRTPYA